MPRREGEQLALFETVLFQAGAIQPYLRNIQELARLLPPSDRDVASSIEQNVVAASRKVRQAIKTHSEFAAVVGYRYLRKEQESGGRHH